MNPMLRTLNASRLSGQIAPVRNMLNMVRNAGNPQAMIGQMLGKNPNYARAMEIIRQNGGDAQKAFYNLAGEMGVNPDDILNELK